MICVYLCVFSTEETQTLTLKILPKKTRKKLLKALKDLYVEIADGTVLVTYIRNAYLTCRKLFLADTDIRQPKLNKNFILFHFQSSRSFLKKNKMKLKSCR